MFEGGENKTGGQQAQFLAGEGLEQAQLEDLAAAFVANYVATGKDLFEGQIVRAAVNDLQFTRVGLIVFGMVESSRGSCLGVASRVRSPLRHGSEGQAPILRQR